MILTVLLIEGLCQCQIEKDRLQKTNELKNNHEKLCAVLHRTFHSGTACVNLCILNLLQLCMQIQFTVV